MHADYYYYLRTLGTVSAGGAAAQTPKLCFQACAAALRLPTGFSFDFTKTNGCRCYAGRINPFVKNEYTGAYTLGFGRNNIAKNTGALAAEYETVFYQGPKTPKPPRRPPPKRPPPALPRPPGTAPPAPTSAYYRPARLTAPSLRRRCRERRRR